MRKKPRGYVPGPVVPKMHALAVCAGTILLWNNCTTARFSDVRLKRSPLIVKDTHGCVSMGATILNYTCFKYISS